MPFLLSANAHEPVILKDAQQLDLHGGRNISGLVDEQRPLMRHFGQTYFSAGWPR